MLGSHAGLPQALTDVVGLFVTGDVLDPAQKGVFEAG